jgi:hypothetical protein
MPTIIVDGKLYISVSEVMSFMQDFANKIENERAKCFRDIDELSISPDIRKMAIDLTNTDYDFFIRQLEYNVKHYKSMLEAAAVKARERCLNQ